MTRRSLRGTFYITPLLETHSRFFANRMARRPTHMIRETLYQAKQIIIENCCLSVVSPFIAYRCSGDEGHRVGHVDTPIRVGGEGRVADSWE